VICAVLKDDLSDRLAVSVAEVTHGDHAQSVGRLASSVCPALDAQEGPFGPRSRRAGSEARSRQPIGDLDRRSVNPVGSEASRRRDTRSSGSSTARSSSRSSCYDVMSRT
jgi:hypothetical protein